MAIKKVVNKTKKVKKFPEFDIYKTYVLISSREHLYQIFKNVTKFEIKPLGHSDSDFNAYDSFEEVSSVGKVYILDGQQELARFLMGCREFPKVKEIEVGEELAEDEVSVEDVVRQNPYDLILACTWSSDNKISVFHPYSCPDCKSKYAFFELTSGISHGNYFTSQEKCIKSTLINNSVYQFDTQEEFLRWSLEQVTGKKF